jgi:ABC-2 type transport system permease protein
MKEHSMRREGSALHGAGVVMLKEIADHFSSVIVTVLLAAVTALAIAVVYLAIGPIKDTVSGLGIRDYPYLFLLLFTRSSLPVALPTLLSTYLVPWFAIVLGFDAINSEHNQRTLSRVLSQPIYRDALLFGKFAAGMFTLAMTFIMLWLMVIGLGLLGLGLPPNAEEMARALVLLVITIVYGGLWFALALLFSVVFRSAAAALVVSIGVWGFVAFVWPWVTPFLTAAVTKPANVIEFLTTNQAFARLSPVALYDEIVNIVLDPSVHSIQQPLVDAYLARFGMRAIEQGSVPGAPISLLQSVLIVWPQIVGLVAGTILLFVVGYVVFQRQEVRA